MFDPKTLLVDLLIPMAVAYVLALPLGVERVKLGAGRVGLRTFPLLALGACAYVILADQLLGDQPDARSRVVQGLMTGIGFVGGGAILKEKGEIHGLATAVSLWNTGALGLAAAYKRYDVALLLALVNLVTLFLTRSVVSQGPQRS